MIYFIGAGPGDPELLTLKAKRVIDSADVIVYAGSLVNPEVLVTCRKDAQIYDSAGMNLDEVLAVMLAAGRKTAGCPGSYGDPSIYGAIREQIDVLEKKIPMKLFRRVSSFVAAAAALGRIYVAIRQSDRYFDASCRQNSCSRRRTLSVWLNLSSYNGNLLSVGQIEKLVAELIQEGTTKQHRLQWSVEPLWSDQKFW